MDYESCNKCQRKRKHQADENNESEVILHGREEFKVDTFYTVLDQLKSELHRRKNPYDPIAENFVVLRNCLPRHMQLSLNVLIYFDLCTKMILKSHLLD